jgi:hypothetical protein
MFTFLTKQLITFFQVDKVSEELGLFKRKGRDSDTFVNSLSDLVNDKVYFLFYKEGDSRVMRSPSPSNGERVS